MVNVRIILSIHLAMGLSCVSQLYAAQEPSPVPSLEEADALFDGEQWVKAADAYQRIANADPSNGQAWLRLGASLHHMKRRHAAVGAFEKAEAAGFDLPATRLALAREYALMGDVETAFEWLGKALDAGFQDAQQLESDPNLGTLREDPRFAEALERAQTDVRPCQQRDVYQEFDFWVGVWDVFSDEKKVGTNTIEKQLDGCLLYENWTSTSAGAGKSINYYNPAKGKWIQTWVDSSGGVIEAEGSLVEGAMHFEGEHLYGDGRNERFRMSLTRLPDGRVRQLIEQSRDGGSTWYVWFDGTYVRR